MAASKMSCINVAIPSTAKEIKVTNVLSPYFIRALDAIEDGSKKQNLCHLVEKVARSYFKRKGDQIYVPKVKHHVILSTTYLNNDKIDLPAWSCRGVVIGASSTKADVLLLDYGIVVNLPNQSLAKYHRSAIPIKPLSISCGIYNIVPLDQDRNVCKEWPKSTIDCVRELIQTSKKIYFETLAHDKNTDRIFGDLFLVFNDMNLCLSRFLIESHMAIELNGELIQTIKTCESDIEIPLVRAEEKQNNNDSNVQAKSPEKVNNIPEAPKNVGNMNKLTVDQILIHSNVSCRPLEHLEDAGFAKTIHKALQTNGVRKLKQIQTYMWPAIKQGLNVTTIAPSSSGKTLGYIIPIANAIASNQEAMEKQKSIHETKPFVLVLCATLKTCVDVTHKFNLVAAEQKNMKSCAFISGMEDKSIVTNICNKFQVLVSTPGFLLHVLSKNYAADLILSELSYLVLDNADVTLSKYFKEVLTLIKDQKIINKDFDNGIQNGPPQTIVVAKTWTSEIESFVSQFVENSYTCIGSFTEAAAFSGVQGRMLIRHSDKKKHEVLGVLNDYQTRKTLIFCLDSSEACELNQFLVDNGVKTLLVHDAMEVMEINDLRDDLQKFLPGMFPVIIFTDGILSEFSISDVEYLIHYSVTDTSKTQFNRRFSVLMDNWMVESDKKCKILILFDETKDSVHFKGVVDILKRLKVNLPKDWDTIANGLELQNNIKKKNFPLCNNIKSFGYCNTNQSCVDRHRVIAEVDVPQVPEIHIGDELRLLVTVIHSVTHYSARILECKKEGGTDKDKKIVTLPHQVALLSMKMKSFYSKIENRRSPKEIAPGAICVVKDSESYIRVKILKIVEIDANKNKPRVVQTQSIDDGNIRSRVNIHELYEISDEFLKYKLPIVNVYLTGISPFDEENEWGDLAKKTAMEWFRKNSKENADKESNIYAKVLMHIGDSIWTDTLVMRSKIIGYGELVSSSLKKFVIDKGHGIENKKHLPHLIDLCVNSGMTEINGQPIDLPKDEPKDKQEPEH